MSSVTENALLLFARLIRDKELLTSSDKLPNCRQKEMKGAAAPRPELYMTPFIHSPKGESENAVVA